VELGLKDEVLAGLDSPAQELLRLATGRNARSSYVKAFRAFHAARIAVDAEREFRMGHSGQPPRPVAPTSSVEVGILSTLRELVPSAGLSYEQALRDLSGQPLTQKVIQVLVRRTARRANVKPGIPAAHVLFAPGDAWGAGKSHSGTGRTPGPGHDAALHALEPSGPRRRNSVVGDGNRNEPRGRGEIVAAGTEGPKAHLH